MVVESEWLSSVPLVERSTSVDDISDGSEPGASATSAEFHSSDMEQTALNTSLDLIGDHPFQKRSMQICI